MSGKTQSYCQSILIIKQLHNLQSDTLSQSIPIDKKAARMWLLLKSWLMFDAAVVFSNAWFPGTGHSIKKGP